METSAYFKEEEVEDIKPGFLTQSSDEQIFQSLFSFIEDRHTPEDDKLPPEGRENDNQDKVGEDNDGHEGEQDGEHVKAKRGKFRPANKGNILRVKNSVKRNIDIKKLISCENCDYKTDNKTLFKHHREGIHEGIVRFGCSLGDYKNFYKQNVKNHIKRHHPEQEVKIITIEKDSIKRTKEHQCHDCHYSTHSEKLFTYHVLNIHQGMKRFKCDVCDFKGFYQHNLKYHIKNHHKGQDVKIINMEAVKSSQGHIRKRNSKISNREKKIKYPCKLCDHLASSPGNLKKHTQIAHEKIKYPCNQCDYQATKSHLQRHIQSLHEKIKYKSEKEGKNKCTECLYSTDNKSLFRNHVSSVHQGIVRFTCDLCDYKSYHKASVRAHYNKYHLGSPVNILPVGREIKTNIGMTLSKGEPKNECHESRKALASMYDCADCNFSTNREQSLTHHKAVVHHGIVRFTCSFCDYQSYYRHLVRSHFANNHQGKEVKFKTIGCEKCQSEEPHEKCRNPESTLRKPRKNYHRNTTINGLDMSMKSFQCDSCNYSSSSESNLLRHVKVVHERTFRYQCGYCEYRNFRKQCLRVHMETTHRKEKEFKALSLECQLCKTEEKHPECKYEPWREMSEEDFKRRRVFSSQCTHCEQVFDNKSLRVKHFRESHPDKKVYNCDYCKYSTNYLPNLKDHVNSLHEKKTLHCCDRCDFKTSWKQLYHRHMRDEHGEHKKKSKHRTNGEPLLCDGCAFSTFSKVKFEYHRTSVHGTQKPFSCQYCGHSTFYAHNLDKHIQKIHTGKSTPQRKETKI